MGNNHQETIQNIHGVAVKVINVTTKLSETNVKLKLKEGYITPLFCSCAWSMAIEKNFLWDLAKWTCHFGILGQHQGGLHRGYTYPLHEQTSTGRSECDLDWRTKVLAWWVCRHTNQSLLYAKNAQCQHKQLQFKCCVPVKELRMLIRTPAAETLWGTLSEAIQIHIVC